jgi:hypothetical protein
MYAPHNWTTTDLLYAEHVDVVNGYALVTHPSSSGNLRSRGYDAIAEVGDEDERSLEELVKVAQETLGHEPNAELLYAAPLQMQQSPYQDGRGNATAHPTH